MGPLEQLKKELKIASGNKKEDIKKLNEWKKSKNLTGKKNSVILKKKLF